MRQILESSSTPPFLRKENAGRSVVAFRWVARRGRDAEVLLRLTGLGLLIEDIHRQQWDVVDTTLIFDDPDEIEKEERVYRRTEFGNRMVSILG